jgi:ATP-dependent protease HslVU (ClpYQ) peptidase subunit
MQRKIDKRPSRRRPTNSIWRKGNLPGVSGRFLAIVEVPELTCILGLKRDGKVYMGADSLYLNGWHIYRSPPPKIFRVGNMLIGTSGSQRVSDILQYNLEVDEDWKEPIDCMTQDFIPALRAALKEHGAMMSDEGRDGIEDSAIMVAYKGCLFIIGEDFSLSEIVEYEAIGAGAKYALGYLWGLGNQDSEDPGAAIEMIENALECAAYFCASCARPWVVEKL